MRKLLFWLTSHLPCRIIAEEGSVYLERYYLFTLLGWRFYLHRFVASDPDRGLHDHPWPRAFSIILAGQYWEETRSGRRLVRWFNSLTGDTFHRVVLPHVGLYEFPCWTLFFHRSGRAKTWGFLRGEAGKAQVFTPYSYATEGDQRHWWERAPKGRDEPRRLPQ